MIDAKNITIPTNGTTNTGTRTNGTNQNKRGGGSNKTRRKR